MTKLSKGNEKQWNRIVALLIVLQIVAIGVIMGVADSKELLGAAFTWLITVTPLTLGFVIQDNE